MAGVVMRSGKHSREIIGEQEVTTAKLAIVILIIAALLFVLAPKLSLGNCNGPRHESGRDLGFRSWDSRNI
ncbi:MAG: hypothetical protein WBV69_21705 [Candidatus Sulfotelmatobacter sp.]